jgi:hypothetical protein
MEDFKAQILELIKPHDIDGELDLSAARSGVH